MRKTGIALSVLLEASLAPCVAGAVTNAWGAPTGRPPQLAVRLLAA